MSLPFSYNLRNLFVRKLSTTLTFCVITVVVLVLAVLMSFAEGIRASLAVSADAHNLIVLKPGATAESTSLIPHDEWQRVRQAPHIARGPAGEPLLSAELNTQTSLPRVGTERRLANVAIRGVDDIAFDVHRNVRLIEGRRFSQGQLELIVGKAAQQRIAGLAVGESVKLGRFGNRVFTVVGVFEAGGGALESELWTGRTVLHDIEGRPTISSVCLRLDDPVHADESLAYIRGPSVRLAVKREAEYYDDLAKTTREIVVLTTTLVAIMAVGAVFAVANTMYATVDSRRREIAMLRTLGFGRAAILVSFVLESLLLASSACALGLSLSLLVSGTRQDFLSDVTWTVLAYELKLTPRIAVMCVVMSLVVGIIGALAPAVRASRVRVIEALRKA